MIFVFEGFGFKSFFFFLRSKEERIRMGIEIGFVWVVRLFVWLFDLLVYF